MSWVWNQIQDVDRSDSAAIHFSDDGKGKIFQVICSADLGSHVEEITACIKPITKKPFVRAKISSTTAMSNGNYGFAPQFSSTTLEALTARIPAIQRQIELVTEKLLAIYEEEEKPSFSKFFAQLNKEKKSDDDGHQVKKTKYNHK